MPTAVSIAVIVLGLRRPAHLLLAAVSRRRALGQQPSAQRAVPLGGVLFVGGLGRDGTCACAARASVRQSDTPGGYQIPQCLRQRVLATGMAQPHKGARRGFQIRWREEDRALVAARAAAMGMTMNDYLLTLVHRDEVDPNGRPQWSSATSPQDQLPGLGLTA